MVNLVYYDLETTGTDVYVDRIVELAGFRENTNTYYHKLFKSDYPSDDASKINGITNDMIKNKPYFKNIIDDFEDFLDLIILLMLLMVLIIIITLIKLY